MKPLSPARKIVAVAFIGFLLLVFGLSFFVARKQPPINIKPKAQAQTATTLYGSLYLRNWPYNNGQTQWSSIIIANNNPVDTTATITIYGNDGALLKSFSKAIAANGVWNSYADGDWLATAANNGQANSSLGWVQVSSPQSLTGVNRILIRNGAGFNSPLASFHDLPLTSVTTGSIYSAMYLRNWPGDNGRTQWTSMILNNPNTVAATASITIYAKTGQVLKTFQKSIPAHGLWNSYSDSDWWGTGNTDGTIGAYGWARVSADQQLFGITRNFIAHGATLNTNIDEFSDFQLATMPAPHIYAPLYLKNWPTSNGRQNTSIIVVNQSDRAATAQVWIYNTLGQAMSSFPINLAPYSSWNSFADPNWNALPPTPSGGVTDGTIGWVEVESAEPLFGINRFRIQTATSSLVNVENTGLIPMGAPNISTPLYLLNWPSDNGYTLWSSIVVGNTAHDTANVTFNIYDIGGFLRKTFTKSIAPKGSFNSYGDADFLNVTGIIDGIGPIGWVQLSADQPVIALNRVHLHQGNGLNTPILEFSEAALSEYTPAGAPPTPTSEPRATATSVPTPTTGISPTATPRPPSPTTTPAPGVTIINLPTQTPFPTQTPVPTLTPTPSITARLFLKVKLQAIEKRPADNTGRFTITLTNAANNLLIQQADFSADNNGIWTNSLPLTFNLLPNTSYAVLVKGPQHLQKRICDVTPFEPKDTNGKPDPLMYFCGSNQNIALSNGDNTLDFSGIYLPACDLPIDGVQNGSCDSQDLSFLFANDQSKDPAVLKVGDLNRDGVINVIDRNLVRFVLSHQIVETR